MKGTFSNQVQSGIREEGRKVTNLTKDVGGFLLNSARSFGNGVMDSLNPKPISTPQGVMGATDAPLPTGSTSKPAQPKVTNASITSQPITPIAQSSYQGGQNMPVVGSTGYKQSQQMQPQSTTGTFQNGGSGYVNSQGQYTGSKNQPNTDVQFDSSKFNPVQATDPYSQSLNTQENYATSQGTPAVNTAVGGLQNIAQNQTPDVLKAKEQYNQFAQQSPLLLADVRNNPNVASEISSGRGQALGQTLSAEQGALAQGVTNALAGQGQQITAGNEAGQMAQGQTGAQQASAANVGSLTQPVAGANYFGSNVNGGIVGQGNNLINQGVSQAIQQASQPGTDPTQLRANLLAQYGPPAAQAFDQAMMNKTGGNYSPGASSASAQQTASQGAETGGQAYQLNLGVQQAEALTPVITNFMSAMKISPTDSKMYNAKINDYIDNIGNSGASSQFSLMMNDLQKFSSQILSAGAGGTPTGVQMATDLQNPRNLSLAQIKDYLTTLKALGNNQVSVLQEQAKASGYTGYAGNQASRTTSVNSSAQGTAPGSGLTSPTGQFLGGVGIDVGKGVIDAAKNLGGQLAGFAAGKLMPLR